MLGVLGAVLALAGVLGIAYAVFRSATVQKTLDLYKGENEALGKAVARLQADFVAVLARAEELEKANGVLQQTVSGKEAIVALQSHLTTVEARRSQEYSAMEARRSQEHSAMMQLLTDLRDQMADIWQAVVRALGER